MQRPINTAAPGTGRMNVEIKCLWMNKQFNPVEQIVQLPVL